MAGVPPRIPLGELTAIPRTHRAIEGKGKEGRERRGGKGKVGKAWMMI